MRSLIVLIVMLLVSLPGVADPAATHIGAGQDRVALGARYDFAVDTSNHETIDGILAGSKTLTWSNNLIPTVNLLFQDHPVWIRFAVHHDSPTRGVYYLELESPMLDSINAYVVTREGNGRVDVQSPPPQGDHHPLAGRPLKHRMPLFEVELPPHADVELYLRIDSRSAIIVPITLWARDALYARYDGLGFYYGLFFGIMGVMALYNFVIWIFIRENAYLYYVGYVLAAMFFQACMNGYGYRYFWHDNEWLVDHALMVGVAMAFLFAGAFVVNFLHLREVDRPGYLAALVGMSVYIPLIYISPYVSEAVLTMIAQPVGIVLSLVAIWVGIRQLRQGSHIARFFVIGWIILVAATNIYTLMLAGYLPYNMVTRHIQEGGMMVEAVMLSFALAARINEERQARRVALETSLKLAEQVNLASQERITAQENMNRELEARVDERTSQLQIALSDLNAANQRLELLSVTDPLTGLSNRRHFDAHFAGLFSQARRHQLALCVLVCDIDHFKRINDTYGHLAGDECLKGVAAILSGALQRSDDLVVRMGGEEFVLVLSATDVSGARAMAERIRAAVEAARFCFDGQTIRFTISIGIARFDAALDGGPDVLLGRADAALYRAKSGGRNCVVTDAQDAL